MQKITIPTKDFVVSEAYLTDDQKPGTKPGEWVATGEKSLALVYYTRTFKEATAHTIKLKMSSIEIPKGLKQEDLPALFLGSVISNSQFITVNGLEKAV